MATQVVTDGLVARWEASSWTSGTSWTDDIAGLSLTFSSSPSSKTDDGIELTSSTTFSGTISSLGLTYPMTLEWIGRIDGAWDNSAPGDVIGIGAYNAGWSGCVNIYSKSASNGLQVDANSSGTLTSGIYGAGYYHFVVVITSGYYIQFYVNAIDNYTITSSTNAAARQSKTYLFNNEGNGRFYGAIQSIRLWNTALTTDQVTTLFTQEESGGDDDKPDIVAGEATNFDYTGSVQTMTLAAGTYLLECWGAQGGTYSTYVGGYGGYSRGILTLTQTTTAYIYVGGQPTTSTSSRTVTSGGFNGGGNGCNRYYSSTYTYGQGGGGGSDIRLGTDSLYARVIVAGGGGGSASSSTDTGLTKYGGGTSGGPGSQSTSATYNAGQTAGTTSGYYLAGTFGQGAAAYTSRTNYMNGSGGGGGGWYGGYAYNYSQDSQTALNGYNGGGSGYVYTSSTASNYPSGCLLNSAYYLTDASTVGGNTSFTTTSGDSTETGHQGNGYVKITVLSVEGGDEEEQVYIKVDNEYKQVVEVYKKVSGAWVLQTSLSDLFTGLSDGDDYGVLE